MKKSIFLIAVSLGLLAMPTAPNSQTKLNVQELIRQCNASEGSPDFFNCIGYVSGASDMMLLNGMVSLKIDPASATTMSVIAMCAASPPTYGARLQAFKNWGQKHPEKWGEETFVGVVEAMRETWPCIPRKSN